VGIGRQGAVRKPLLTVGRIGELTDGQLLARFATCPGEVAELAFAALVERHGRMVMRVARGVLTDPNDAQDAFQATFLVLIKKARGLWVRDSLGPWLHQVAYRTACCARSTDLRRRAHERNAATRAALRLIVENGAGDEWEQVLHAEIERLPERFRAPIVLCDLEGQSHEQAARHMGWPVGTVKSRLSRGRERLRAQLRRRGLGPDAAALAAALGTRGAAEVISTDLLLWTTTAAVKFLSADTLANAFASVIAMEVLKAMSLSCWLKFVSVLAALASTALGAELLAQQGAPSADRRADDPPKAVRKHDPTVFEVKRGKLAVTVFARGTVEPVRRDFLIYRLPFDTTIVSILPEGTKVMKGQLVCELDSAALRDNLTNQNITAKGAEAAYQNARLARENAEQESKPDVEQARSTERDRMLIWELEKSKERKLRFQIESCKLLAPRDGPLVYANDANAERPSIFPGAKVRQGQIIGHIPDLSGFVVNAKVAELSIDRIRAGQRAQIKIDAFPKRALGGQVVQVSPLPDATSFASEVKRYPTKVWIHDAPPGLEPGMSAEVAIIVAELEDALSVPLSAIVSSGDNYSVAVRKPDGSLEWRDVMLGVGDEFYVQITSGIKSGESIVLKPGE
jgi:RND family efflux transporter MFP subunit